MNLANRATWRDVLKDTIQAARDGKHPQQAGVLLEHYIQAAKAGESVPKELHVYIAELLQKVLSTPSEPAGKLFGLIGPKRGRGRPPKPVEYYFNIAQAVHLVGQEDNAVSVEEAAQKVAGGLPMDWRSVRDIYYDYARLFEKEKPES